MKWYWTSDEKISTFEADSSEEVLALEACGGPNGTPRYTRTNGSVYKLFFEPRTNGTGCECALTFWSFLAVEAPKRSKPLEYLFKGINFFEKHAATFGVLSFRALTHEAHELKLLDV